MNLRVSYCDETARYRKRGTKTAFFIGQCVYTLKAWDQVGTPTLLLMESSIV